MINIIIPIGGKSQFFEGEYFPKPLCEIKNKLMIEYPILSLSKIREEKRFIFIVRDEDCVKFHLDQTLKLLTAKNTIIMKLKSNTRGAACSALLAIDYINNSEKLIISNADQYIDVDCNKVLAHFQKQNADGGVICFESVHPQWSYAKLDDNSNIVQTAEKNPISKNAIAGFYYFRRGQDFVSAAEKSIENDAHVNGNFYIAPVYNELVLEGKCLKSFHLKANHYFSFYSFPKIREFENQKINIKL